MSLLEAYARHVSRPYVEFVRRFGIDFSTYRALGATVEDQTGRKYIDCIGGYGNSNIGHNHPRVIEAMVHAFEAAGSFAWPFVSEAHVQLVEKLSEVAPGGLDCGLIVNTGAEAVDSALKLARLATGRPGIICCQGAMHGFTMGAMSVSEPHMGRNFEPLLPAVRRVPYGDVRATAEAISPEIGAIIVEPIQAESGAQVPPSTYLRDLATLCTGAKALLIIDEIKSGMAKTGKMFACEFEAVEPDVLLVGKSLGGGVMPIGAMLARRKCWTKVGPRFAMTASSSAGNRFACTAGLAALEVIQSENLCANAEKQGRRLRQAIVELCSTYSQVAGGESGRGLLLGLHTESQKVAHEIATECVRRGVLVMPAFLDRACILIEPPLCIDDSQVDQVICVLQQACAAVSTRHQ